MEPNDDHGIDNFKNDLARDNASYQEEERYKEDRIILLLKNASTMIDKEPKMMHVMLSEISFASWMKDGS
nr:hypothetical protein [Tanacetum cinerariifolium]